MEVHDSSPPSSPNPWKVRIIKFVIYLVVGFLCAYLFGRFKN